MLNFRNINLLFGLAMILVLILNAWLIIPLSVYILFVIGYCLLFLYGISYIGSNFFMKVLCSGATTEKIISISFDDGPAGHFTPEILHVLNEQKVLAAFFCIGKKIVKNEPLLRQLHEHGHIIGNHSFSHTPLFDFKPYRQMLLDVQMTDTEISRALGVTPKLFRPPYGITTPAMRKVVEKGNYTTIGWNIRSFDTVTSNEKKLLKRLTRLLKPGAVILLHDTRRVTLDILPKFIQAARNEGYEFVRLDKLLNVKVYD